MNYILEKYFPIADLIAGTFGKECEVAVHDLENPEQSVVYVVNGEVTGRAKGQSFDHLIKNVLLSKNFKEDRLLNYTFETSTGKKIRSSSLLIRDEKKKVIGMICINYNTTLYLAMQDSLNAFFANSSNTKFAETDEPEPDQDVMAIIDELIMKIIGSNDTKNLNRKRCVELVKFMDDKGIFLVKGAMDKVAELMGVSRITIYSYLDEAKGKR